MKKVAFITGATRGIGKEIAIELAKNGYDIAINYRNNKEEINEVKNKVMENNVDFFAVKLDISDYEECKKSIKEIINHYEKIDVLVNNAGITKDSLLLRMKKVDFDDVIDINLKGTFNVTKNVVPFMVKNKNGRIINIASIVGITGNVGQANYSASKAGVIGFTKSLAKELASRNILVNSVAPGFIQTQMTEILKEDIKDNIKKQIPLKRFGNTKDVANVVKFLASKDSSYITGQVINVDGGMLI